VSSFPNSSLGEWIARLRQEDPSLTVKDGLDVIDREALDNAVGFAAEHARRYVATDGAEDGWDGPRPILLLYTKGRRTGAIRRNPLLYFEHEGQRYLIGSKGGDDRHPEWYLNLVANPRVHVRVMEEVYEAEARTLEDEERGALWPELVARYPMFADYQQATARQIPVVHLRPLPDAPAYLGRQPPADVAMLRDAGAPVLHEAGAPVLRDAGTPVFHGVERDNYQHYKHTEFESFAHLEGLIPAEQFLIDRFFVKDLRTLEAGTGGGRILHSLHAAGFSDLHGYDFLEEFVRVAKGKDRAGDIDFLVGDAACLPYRDDSFDQVVYLEQMVCQLNEENRELATAEAHRILKPGGTALFSFLSHEARSRELLYKTFLAYLKTFRRLASRTNRSIQSQPWLKHGGKWNPSALLDKPPYVYWFTVREAVELLQRHGFEVIAAASSKEAEAGYTVDHRQLLEGDVTEKLFLVARK
jgi:deazaflavin-dependent oxidoreductase (nitroreductase family)